MNVVFSNAADAKTLAAHFMLGGVDILQALSSEPPKYEEHQVVKGDGTSRKVLAPKDDLKKAQLLVKKELELIYITPEEVYGFQKSRGIKGASAVHIRSSYMLSLDLDDFFNSITRKRVAGLLRKLLPDRSADFYSMLLNICTHDNCLPQGSPCSPILSNMIMYRFDNEISKQCKLRGLRYSRYADDINISTRGKSFSVQFAFRSVEGNREVVRLGPVLEKVLNDNGFRTNTSKTRLVGSHYRMRTLGLVVNEKLNLQRSEVRRLRAIIHKLETENTGGTDHFRKAYTLTFSKTLPNEEGGEVEYFKKYLRGRLYYLRYIKGDHDPTYRKLAKRYKALDEDFKYDDAKVDLSHIKIKLRVEGTTDIKHLENALSYFVSKKKYADLNIEFIPITNNNKGSSNMRADIEYKSRNSSTNFDIELYIFDRDEDEVIKSMSDQGKNFKRHGQGLYSLVIPVPSNRSGKVCIEHFYEDETIKKVKSSDGRRLYFREEFIDSWHKTEHVVYPLLLTVRTLVAEAKVYDAYTKKEVCLRKGEFAHLISESKEIDYSSFIKIFDEIYRIRTDYYRRDILKLSS